MSHGFFFLLNLNFQILNVQHNSQPLTNDLLGINGNLTPNRLETLNEVTSNLPNDGMVIDAGTVTPKPTTIQLNDIFLAVKTTQTNHAKRLSIIAKTWFQMAREQVISIALFVSRFAGSHCY